MNTKQKLRNSFSVPKRQNARGRYSSRTMARQHHSQGKDTSEIVASSSTSTNFSASVVGHEENTISEIIEISDDARSSMDDDGWLTDSSIEQMRCAGLTSLDESVVPHSLSLKDVDLASLVFLDHGNGPIAYSTPRSRLDKSFTLSDTDFQVKSISPVQYLPVPDISNDAIKERQEKCEDSLVYSKALSYDCLEISEDSDEYTKQNLNEKDGGYSKSGSFATTVINKSTNSNARNRKQEVKVENSIENMDDYSNEDLGEAQNIKIASMKKGKGNRVYNRINGYLRRKQNNKHRHLFKYERKSDNNFKDAQKIENDEFIVVDELDNNEPQVVALKKKNKANVFIGADNERQQDVSVLNRSQISTSLRSQERNKRVNLPEDVDTLDNDSFEDVQIVQNEEVQDYESSNNQHKTASHQRKTNNRVKFTSILNKSNSNQTEKHGNTIRNSLKDVDNYSRVEKFEKSDTPRRKGTLQRGVNLKFSDRMKKPLKRALKNGRENLFEDIDKGESEDTIKNFQNIQNELLNDELDNIQPKTATRIIKRKINKYVEGNNIRQQNASIANTSQGFTSLRRMHKNKEENSFANIDSSNNKESFENAHENPNGKDVEGDSSRLADNYNKGDNFKEARYLEIQTSREKRKLYRGIGMGVKRNGRIYRSRKAVTSLSTSKKSTSRRVSENSQNNHSEAEKINWPRCCLESPKALLFGKQTFHLLQPVFRDDFPVDSITLVNLGIASKIKCKH